MVCSEAAARLWFTVRVCTTEESVSVLATTDVVATLMVWMIVVVVLNEAEVNVDGKTVVITLFLRVR